MSKQLAVSTAFSILLMAAYVLFGANAARESFAPRGAIASPVEISAPAFPHPASLFPSLR
jgi:hypothetical protein